MQICTRLRWRKAMFWKLRFRIEGSDQGLLENTGRSRSERRQRDWSVFFETHWNGKSDRPLFAMHLCQHGAVLQALSCIYSTRMWQKLYSWHSKALPLVKWSWKACAKVAFSSWQSHLASGGNHKTNKNACFRTAARAKNCCDGKVCWKNWWHNASEQTRSNTV